MSKQNDCKSFLLFLLSFSFTTFYFLTFLSFSFFLVPFHFLSFISYCHFWLFPKFVKKKNYRLYRLRRASLDPFAQLRKATITFVISVSLSVPVEQLVSY